MRRLPIFFLLDISELMVGENLYKLEEGLASIVRQLRTDPHALETAYLSVIGFAGGVPSLAPLSELVDFYPPELPVGGGTALGKALEHLMIEIDHTVVKTTPDRKGDWKPIVFLMTDGHPTDDPTAAIERWNEHYRRRAHLVAVSIGGGADHGLLSKLSEDVLILEDTEAGTFKLLIHWVTLSIQAQSRSVSAGADEAMALAKTDDVVTCFNLDKKRHVDVGVDERFAIFVAKCQSTKLPYLIKYEQRPAGFKIEDPVLAAKLKTSQFVLKNTYTVKNTYFELSGDGPAPKGELRRTHRTAKLPALRHAIRLCSLRLRKSSLHRRPRPAEVPLVR